MVAVGAPHLVTLEELDGKVLSEKGVEVAPPKLGVGRRRQHLQAYTPTVTRPPLGSDNTVNTRRHSEYLQLQEKKKNAKLYVIYYFMSMELILCAPCIILKSL